eukprot:765752-Hanusia_phi.AAC.2
MAKLGRRMTAADKEGKTLRYGNFSFTEKEKFSPYLKKGAAGSKGVGLERLTESPTLKKLVSTDHMEFQKYTRGALLDDVLLLTRYKDMLEEEMKQLRVERIRLDKQILKAQRTIDFGSRSTADAPSSSSREKERGREREGKENRAKEDRGDESGVPDGSARVGRRRSSQVDAYLRKAETSCGIAFSLAQAVNDLRTMRRGQGAGDDVSESEEEEESKVEEQRPPDAAAQEADMAAVLSLALPAERSTVGYDILLVTGNCRSAGSKANVWVSLVGSQHELPITWLTGPKATAVLALPNFIVLQMELTISLASFSESWRQRLLGCVAKFVRKEQEEVFLSRVERARGRVEKIDVEVRIKSSNREVDEGLLSTLDSKDFEASLEEAGGRKHRNVLHPEPRGRPWGSSGAAHRTRQLAVRMRGGEGRGGEGGRTEASWREGGREDWRWSEVLAAGHRTLGS